MGDFGFRQPGISLGAALASMPLEVPDTSAWPALAERLAPEKHWPRWPLALTASLLALLLLPHDLPTADQQSTPSIAHAAATRQLELAELMSESSRLERLVAVASDDGASSATAAAFSLELGERLNALDTELEANRDPGRQVELWQQRLQLLRSVAAVEASRHYLAAEGRNFDVALVAAY
jgi:hypothetical protein